MSQIRLICNSCLSTTLEMYSRTASITSCMWCCTTRQSMGSGRSGLQLLSRLAGYMQSKLYGKETCNVKPARRHVPHVMMIVLGDIDIFFSFVPGWGRTERRSAAWSWANSRDLLLDPLMMSLTVKGYKVKAAYEAWQYTFQQTEQSGSPAYQVIERNSKFCAQNAFALFWLTSP